MEGEKLDEPANLIDSIILKLVKGNKKKIKKLN